VPTEKMRDMVRKTRSDIEAHFGRTTALERFLGAGFLIFGKARELRTSLWGDALQPPTRVVHYNGNK